MNKLIAAILLLCSTYSQAQSISFGSIVDKSLMGKVASDAVYLLRQDYYIVDTTAKVQKKLGLNKQPYFGRFYFLAVFADGKFYTESNINSPWKLHGDFALINAEKKYLPVLSTLAYCKLGQSNFKIIDSTITADAKRRELISQLNEYGAIKVNEALPSLQLANAGAQITDTTAWFWTAKAPSAKVQAGKISLDSSTILDFELSKGKYIPSKKAYYNNSFLSDKTIGGFIFLTRASLGHIDFQLHGLVSRRPDGKLSFIPINNKESIEVDQVAESASEKKELVVEEIVSPDSKSEPKQESEKNKKQN